MGDRNSRCGKFISVLTNHPGQLSLAIPSWVGAMSTGQRALMLCDWGVKADTVLFAGNTVWSISERVRGVCVDALYKSTFTLLCFRYRWNIDDHLLRSCFMMYKHSWQVETKQLAVNKSAIKNCKHLPKIKNNFIWSFIIYYLFFGNYFDRQDRACISSLGKNQ